jgi:hypothetical protein
MLNPQTPDANGDSPHIVLSPTYRDMHRRVRDGVIGHDAADFGDPAPHLDPKRPQQRLGDGADRDTCRGLTRAGALEDVAPTLEQPL